MEKPGYSDLLDAKAAHMVKSMREAYQIPKVPDLIANDVSTLNKHRPSILKFSAVQIAGLWMFDSIFGL